MKTFELTFTGGDTKVLPGGVFFMLLESVGAVDVNFVRNAQSLNESGEGILAGYKARPEGGFDSVRITSATAQVITCGVSRGAGDYDRSAGSVTATIANGTTIATGQVTIGTAAAVILAADTTRRSVFIQNQSTTATLYIGAAGVTTGTGWKITPGSGINIDKAPGAAIYGIASAAGTTVVYLVEKD